MNNFAPGEAVAGILGLLIFFGFFVVMLVWVFRPGSTRQYEADARIPLEEDDHVEKR